MLAHRLRSWPNIGETSGRCGVFAGRVLWTCLSSSRLFVCLFSWFCFLRTTPQTTEKNELQIPFTKQIEWLLSEDHIDDLRDAHYRTAILFTKFTVLWLIKSYTEKHSLGMRQCKQISDFIYFTYLNKLQIPLPDCPYGRISIIHDLFVFAVFSPT